MNPLLFASVNHCECSYTFLCIDERSSGSSVSTGSNVGAITGGVVGAMLAVVILLILIVVILVIIFKHRNNDVNNQGIFYLHSHNNYYTD